MGRIGSWLSSGMIYAGAGLVAVAAGMVDVRAGILVGGVELAGMGVLIARAS